MASNWSETGSGLKQKLKVSTLDIHIKQSGLKVSNCKIASFGS